MKKTLKLLTLVLALVLVLGACGDKKTSKKADANENKQNQQDQQKDDQQKDDQQKDEHNHDADKDHKLVVACTTTFAEDIVRQLAGDMVEIKLIIPAGSDPHTYEPKPNDVQIINDADLVIYHGLHFEGQMGQIFESNADKCTKLAEYFEEDQIGKMDEDGEQVIDPHFWFDLALYKKAVESASHALQKALPEQASHIAEHEEAYLKKLDELDVYVSEKISEIPKESRYLITPHDAFNYFSRSYDIPVQAPQGVSTEGEVASADILETVDFIVDNKIKAIFAESTTDPARMDKLQEEVKNRGFEVKVVKGDGRYLYSDSLAPKGEPGDTFIDMYKHNVDLINENLK